MKPMGKETAAGTPGTEDEIDLRLIEYQGLQ